MVGKWSWKLTPGFFALEGSRSSQHAPCKRSYKTFPGLEQVQAHSVTEPLSSRSVGQDWQPGRLEDPSNSRRWLEEDKLCECIRVVPDILNLWSPTTGGEECELRLANTTRRPKSHQVPCGRNTLGMDQQNGSPFEGQTFGLTASNNRQQHASAAWGSEGLRTTDSNKPFPSGGTGTLLRPCRWQRASSSSWLRSCLCEDHRTLSVTAESQAEPFASAISNQQHAVSQRHPARPLRRGASLYFHALCLSCNHWPPQVHRSWQTNVKFTAPTI